MEEILKAIINSKSYRYYADEGKLVGSVWNDIKSMQANSPLMDEYTIYPNQKPISLLTELSLLHLMKVITFWIVIVDQDLHW